MYQRDNIDAIRELLFQWVSGEEMDQTERDRLAGWAEASPYNELLLNQLQDNQWLAEQLEKMSQVDVAGNWQLVHRYLHKESSSRRGTALLKNLGRWKIVRAAAAVLIVLTTLGIGKWWSYTHRDTLPVVQPFLPSGTAAANITLTLTNGRTIQLDGDRHQQQVTEPGDVRLTLQDSGLTYLAASGNNGIETTNVYNTLTVPIGRQYRIVLADGTKVWLNTSSSLRYPVQFKGKKREVELSGEAYFEVAPDVTAPFTVRTPEITTEVLATGFNVRDYPNEQDQRTTLIEGKVKVRRDNLTILLDSAGQEAQLEKGTSILKRSMVNAENRVIWKEGYFSFDQFDIRASMLEVARWYRKDLRFEGDAEHAQIGVGNARRNQTLPELLSHLQRADLHFELKDNSIVVSR